MRFPPLTRTANRYSRYGCWLLFVGIFVLSSSAKAQIQAQSRIAPTLPSAPKVGGPEVDRIVATVNGDLILDSDVNEELRFDSLKLSQTSALPASVETEQLRDKAIERLIDRDLILQQIQMQPEYTPSADAVTKDIEDLRKTIPACGTEYHCDTQTGWDGYLASAGFTESSFRDEWIDRMKVLAFTEQRFKMGIRISQAQIKDYYEKTLLPEYAEQHAKPAPLDKVSDRIQAILLERQVTSLLNDWLQSLRAQGNVVVMHPGDTP